MYRKRISTLSSTHPLSATYLYVTIFRVLFLSGKHGQHVVYTPLYLEFNYIFHLGNRNRSVRVILIDMLKEHGINVGWIQLAHDRIQCQLFVYTAMKLRSHKNVKFLVEMKKYETSKDLHKGVSYLAKSYI
jgi:hypothetical protein